MKYLLNWMFSKGFYRLPNSDCYGYLFEVDDEELEPSLGGFFHWFPSLNGMLEGVESISAEAYGDPYRSVLDHSMRREAIKTILDSIWGCEKLTKKNLRELNRYIKPYGTELLWWGKAESLATSTLWPASDLRADFWQYVIERDDFDYEMKIPKKKQGEFFEFIHNRNVYC